jgi:hypothetical protein
VRLVAEPLPIEIFGGSAELLVSVREVAWVRSRVTAQLLGGWDFRADPIHPGLEPGVCLDVRPGAAATFAARGQDRVVPLAPNRHRRAPDDVIGPGEPGHEERRSGRDRRARAEQALPRDSLPEQRTDDDERWQQHEHRADERERGGERGGRRPRCRPAALPRPREHVRRRQDEEAGERLRQDECDVVLGPRIDRVEQPGEQADAFAEPAPHGQDQEHRPGAEEDPLAEERGRVVALQDRLLAEEGEIERIARRAKRLPLGGLPGGLADAGAGDVVPAALEDEVEPGLQRCRVRAVAECVAAGDVRPAVRLFVRADQRDVQRAVEGAEHCEEERRAPEGHGRGL